MQTRKESVYYIENALRGADLKLGTLLFDFLDSSEEDFGELEIGRAHV